MSVVLSVTNNVIEGVCCFHGWAAVSGIIVSWNHEEHVKASAYLCYVSEFSFFLKYLGLSFWLPAVSGYL